MLRIGIHRPEIFQMVCKKTFFESVVKVHKINAHTERENCRC
jgi:hypothetical protein